MTAARPILLAFAGFTAMAAALGVGRFVYTPILPVMAEALALSKAEAGLIASANFLGYLVGALIAATPGWTSLRRSSLLLALVINAVLLAAMGVTESFAAHLSLRFAAGLASAFVLVLASTLVMERLAAMGRGGLSALHFAGVGAGIAISAAMVAVLMALDAGWRTLWIASGALGLLAVAIVAALLPKTAPELPRAGAGSPAAVPISLRALIVSYGLFGFGYIITATFIVDILRDTPTLRPMEPFIWAVVGISGALSMAVWFALARSIGAVPAYALACLVEAAGVASSVLWVSPAGMLVAAALFGGTFMGITALGLAAARQSMGGDPGRNIALMTAAFGAGQIVGPTFAGMLFDRMGSFTIPSLAAAAALIAAAALAAFAASAERQERAATAAG